MSLRYRLSSISVQEILPFFNYEGDSRASSLSPSGFVVASSIRDSAKGDRVACGNRKALRLRAQGVPPVNDHARMSQTTKRVPYDTIVSQEVCAFCLSFVVP